MDTSGSMDTMKKYLARSFFFLLYQFISTRYRNVEIVFIAHHTEASEVSEEEFFHKGESGGTFISSGYAKALEIIAERYHPSLWNLYAFHCSDGDNFDSDNPAALKDAEELAEICNLFGYGEIKPLGSRYYESSMLNVFRRIQAPNFHTVLIERKEDIWPSFKAFLAKDRVKESMSAHSASGRGPRYHDTGISTTSSNGTRRFATKATEFGLDCYPQEFELCDHTGMLGYMAYSGMPSHYPHWSYGKSYEKLKTLYDHGVSGLPYEMVINSNPAIAYLMRDNSLLLQVLTIAHVYGHNDFFKNNFTFKSATRAELTIEIFKVGRDARAALRRGSVDRSREGRAHSRRGACAVMAVPAQLRDQEAVAARADGARGRYCAGTARSVSENPRAQDRLKSPTSTRSRSSPTRTSCSSSAITTRSSPTAKRICSPSSTRKPSTSSP